MISHPEGGHYVEIFKNDNVSQIYTNLTTPALQQARTSMNFYNHSSNGWLCNKGIFFNIPIFGNSIAYTWRPLTKDPGARLVRRNTLHDLLVRLKPID